MLVACGYFLFFGWNTLLVGSHGCGLRACGDDSDCFLVLSLFLCWLVVGALLGVWDGTLCCSCVQVAACHVGTACGGGLFCGVWVLCENWIVDASILFFCKFDFLDSFSVF